MGLYMPCEISSDPRLLMGGVAASRLGLWMLDLAVIQQMQDHVPETDRCVVGGVQNSLQAMLVLTLAFRDIVAATENFEEKYCIGRGSQGSVYKVKLETGRVVAVKRIHKSNDGINDADLKGFESEIEALTEIRHQNIMSGQGSLGDILSRKGDRERLEWSKRLKIIKGVAHALSYMHHDCRPATVHRDISRNNVLLDSEFEAHISDFGTSRLLRPDESIWTTVAGAYGYIAPAFAVGIGDTKNNTISGICGIREPKKKRMPAFWLHVLHARPNSDQSLFPSQALFTRRSLTHQRSGSHP
ncbi:hypothetical protein ACLOJK_011261 [Asimina triloba]